MSRTKARKTWRGDKLQRELKHRGIYIRTASLRGLAEEAGGAYKNIDDVVAATTQAGLSKPVARFVPLGNVKG
jgi:tRNA-splicing ligase RtcB